MVYHALPRIAPRKYSRFLTTRDLPHDRRHVYTVHPRCAPRNVGWTLFGLVWGLALAGTVLTVAGGVRVSETHDVPVSRHGVAHHYRDKPLWLRMPSEGLFWLLAGGIAYTVGVVFYSAKRVRYSHFVWHLFVIAGTACHFIAVLRFAA